MLVLNVISSYSALKHLEMSRYLCSESTASFLCFLHLVVVVCPQANHCLPPDADEAWRAEPGRAGPGRGSLAGWEADLVLCMNRVSRPVIRFPLPRACVNRSTAARLAFRPWLSLEGQWYYGVGAPLPDALSEQAGALTEGLLCILTYPSRRAQSRCPPFRFADEWGGVPCVHVAAADTRNLRL